MARPTEHERFLPRCSSVLYEGRRADKARTGCEMHDPGFHGYQVDCKVCGTVARLEGRCPLCGQAGPLRERPE